MLDGMANISAKPSVGDIAELMEQWAPAWTAEDWDRVGLLAGDPATPVGKAWVALDLSPDLLSAALAADVQLILTHHPPIFKPLNNLRMDNPGVARLARAAAAGLALFAAHTNLDAAPGGVNDALAQRLGLVDPSPLDQAGRGGLLKLACFVPASHHDQLAQALFAAGAGRIGDYDQCSFSVAGRGHFLAPDQASPFVGQAGQANTVDELRLEVVLPATAASRAIAALLTAHPYQEPAYDLYPLRQGPSGFGVGRVGDLPRPEAGQAFLARAVASLAAPTAQVCGPLPPTVRRVAVVGGSGAEYLAQAAAMGAQVLITGEAGYHAAEQAGDLGVCLACLGHYQTEVVIVEPWARRLSAMLERLGFACEIKACVDGNGPWRPAV